MNFAHVNDAIYELFLPVGMNCEEGYYKSNDEKKAKVGMQQKAFDEWRPVLDKFYEYYKSVFPEKEPAPDAQSEKPVYPNILRPSLCKECKGLGKVDTVGIVKEKQVDENGKLLKDEKGKQLYDEFERPIQKKCPICNGTGKDKHYESIAEYEDRMMPILERSMLTGYPPDKLNKKFFYVLNKLLEGWGKKLRDSGKK
jgi:hypothetical protein